MDYVKGLLGESFVLIILCIGMLLLLFTNNMTDKKRVNLGKILIISILVVSILDYTEYYVGAYTELRVLRLILSVLCYDLRPFICLMVAFYVTPKRKYNLLLAIPEIINIIIYILPFFTKIVFYFDEEFIFQRGVLGYTAHVVSFIYIAYSLASTFIYIKLNRKVEGFIILLSGVFIITAILLETFNIVLHILWPTSAIAVTFYYFFVYIQSAQNDELTGLLNRKTYYHDAEKEKRIITGVIAIDMNDLKEINDNQGHEAGDQALITIANAISSALKEKCIAYRKGGDEFNVICIGVNQYEIEQTIGRIKDNLLETQFSCSIGYALMENDKTFEQVEILADKQMYIEKNKYHNREK